MIELQNVRLGLGFGEFDLELGKRQHAARTDQPNRPLGRRGGSQTLEGAAESLRSATMPFAIDRLGSGRIAL